MSSGTEHANVSDRLRRYDTSHAIHGKKQYCASTLCPDLAFSTRNNFDSAHLVSTGHTFAAFFYAQGSEQIIMRSVHSSGISLP